MPPDTSHQVEENIAEISAASACMLNSDVQGNDPPESEPKQKDVWTSTNVHTADIGVETADFIRAGQYLSVSFVDDEHLHYFSGLERKRFNAVRQFVFRNSPELPNSALSAEDILFLTLTEYKHNMDCNLVAYLFKIERKLCSQLFDFCTNLMYSRCKCIYLWSLRKNDEQLYTAIIDCTEIPFQSSSNPEIQQHLFSQYKNRPTGKALVAIDEAGTVIVCSDFFGGSTSDRQMVIRSGFMCPLQKGDVILADRGFTISDLLESKGVGINIPAFKRQRKQLTESEVMETRVIANRRIHIERVIAPIYGILNTPLPTHLCSQIFFNCIALCNFRSSIV